MNIAFQDIVDRLAYTEISGEARVRLAELAGAPWCPDDPEAVLGEEQKEILRRDERIIAVEAGSRGGKSMLAGCFCLAELMQPNRHVAIVASYSKHAASEFKYVYKGMLRLFGDYVHDVCPVFTQRTEHNNFYCRIETVWGSTIEAMTLQRDQGAKALGSEWDMCCLAEGSRITPNVYFGKIVRALAGRAKKRKRGGHLRRTGRTIAMSTPNETEGAIYQMVQAAKKRTNERIELLRTENCPDWRESIYYKRLSVLEMNPSFSAEELEAQRKHFVRAGQQAYFDEQFLGIARAREGLIYNQLTDGNIISPPPQSEIQKMELGIGIDTGYWNAAVLVGRDTKDRTYCLGEVLEKGVTIRTFLSTLREMVDDIVGIPDYLDEIQTIVVDRASEQKREIQECDLSLDWHENTLNLEVTCDEVNRALAAGRLYISSECTETIHDFENYAVKGSVTNATNTPVKPKGRDHLLDALRYVLIRMWEAAPPEEEPEPLTREERREKTFQDNIRRLTDWRAEVRHEQQLAMMRVIGGW